MLNSVDLSYGMSEISMIPMTMMDDPNVLFPPKRVENSTSFQFYREFLEFNKRIGVIQISYCKIHSCAAEQNWCKARPSFCTHLRHHGSLRTCSHRILEKYCLSPSLCYKKIEGLKSDSEITYPACLQPFNCLLQFVVFRYICCC